MIQHDNISHSSQTYPIYNNTQEKKLYIVIHIFCLHHLSGQKDYMYIQDSCPHNARFNNGSIKMKS